MSQNITTDSLIQILKSSADFGELAPAVIEDLVSELTIKQIASGELVFNEGDVADWMFFVVSGRLRVSRQTAQGELLLYNEVLPGDCVGEMAMILKQERTADITALRDSVIAVLSEESYQKLITRYPVELTQAFSQAIYRTLRHAKRVAERNRARSYGVIALSEDIDLHLFGQQLAQAANLLGKTERIELTQAESLKSLEQIDKLEAENQFLLYLCPMNFEGAAEIISQVDQIIFVANNAQSKTLTGFESQLQGIKGYQLIRKHLAVIYPDEERFCLGKNMWLGPREVERIYPVHLSDEQDFQRLFRFVNDRAIGVVLGGGGARGFAHIGVLQAFEEYKVPIDILGGNSMGAVIGACVAYGLSREETVEGIIKLTQNGMSLDLPIVSLLSSSGFEKGLTELFGDIDVESLWLPFFTAACNLSSASTYVLDNGPLWQAVLASNSPAGLLPPVVRDQQMLVDGAILENVPVEAMRVRLGTALEKRRGNGIVIAIDVDVKEDLNLPTGVDKLTSWDAVKSRFDSNRPNLPGLGSILMQVAHVGGLAQRGRTIAAADIYLEPPVTHFPMMGYEQAQEIAKAGYDYTVEQIKNGVLKF